MKTKKQEPAFSLFRRLTTNNSSERITLADAYRMVTTDASLKETTAKYRYFRSIGFAEDADKLKRGACPAFTPAAVFDGGRSYKSMVTFTGYSLVDIDKRNEAEVAKMVERLADDPYWLLAYVTLSGCGLRIIFRVEGVTDRFSYLKAFHQGNEHYCRLLGVADYDTAVKDATRCSVLCHDPHALYREEAEVFPVDYGKVSVGEVWSRVERQLARRGCAYEAGRHNEYISGAGYLLNRYGVDEADAVEWLQRRFADYDPLRIESHIRSCYAGRADEHASLTVAGGKARRKAAGEESSKYIGVEDIEACLAQLVDLRWNEITRLTEVRWKDASEPFRPLTDRDEGSLWSRINKQGRTMRFADLRLVIASEYVPVFHPFRAYFENLPEWHEGDTDHIRRLAETVTLADPAPEAAQVFFRCLRKWLVAMVAGFLTDRVNHEILVLIGRQGIFKTTWFHYLLPPELRAYYVAKNNSRRMSKDDRLLLAEAGLICLEEIVAMSDEELEQIKAAVSMPQVVERAAYARNKEVRPHLASFCGTGNHLNFLTDLTGNRRWLPFEVTDIRSPYDHPLDYEALYAQVMHLWRGGFPYWFDRAEIAELAAHVSRFEAPNLEEELITTYFRPTLPGEPYEVYGVADILSVINVGMKAVLSQTKVGMLMNKLGFKKVRNKKVRGYMVYRYSMEEICRDRKGDSATETQGDLPFPKE